MRLMFLLGEEGRCGTVAGDSGDLDSDLGSESDPLRVLEKVLALSAPSFPSSPASILPVQAASCQKICGVISVRRKSTFSERVHFSSLI